jgi:hypothetical protein
MIPTPTLTHMIRVLPPVKSNPYCPVDTILITGMISLIAFILIAFFIVLILKKLIHLNISNIKLFISVVIIIMILSLIKNYFLFYPDVPWYPFPFWLLPIDCL